MNAANHPTGQRRDKFQLRDTWESSQWGDMEIDIANAAAAAIAFVALGISIYTLVRQHRLERIAYVTLRLNLNRHNANTLVAETALEHRSPTPKYVDVVRLLICPEEESPERACNTLTKSETFNHLNDIGALELEHMLQDDHRMLIPLHYYTKENTEIADEHLTYDHVIDIEHLTPGTIYAVRMFLYGPNRLHRVVHRAFIR